MALGWLADVASAAVGIAGLFKGNKEPEGLDEYRALIEQQQQYARDIANPPAAQVNQEEGTLRRDFAEALRMAMTADRREKARDRGGLFYDRERQDETVARTAASYYDQVKGKARENVRGYLAQAAQANNIALTATGNLVNTNATMDAANQSMQASGFDALFQSIKGLDKGLPQLVSSFQGMLDGSSSRTTAARTNNPLTAGNWGSSSYWGR